MSQPNATVPQSLEHAAWAQAQLELTRQGVFAENASLESLALCALQVLAATISASRASLSVLDPMSGLLTIAAAVGSPDARVGQVASRPRSVSDWVMRVGRGIVLQGTVRTGEIQGNGDTRIQSSMVIPLSGDRGTLGVLSLGRGPAMPAFTEGDLPIAMATLIPLSLALSRRLDAARAQRALTEMDAAARAPGAPWRGRALGTPHYDCAAMRHPSREHGWSFVTWGAGRDGAPVLFAADRFAGGIGGLERARTLEGVFQTLCHDAADFAELIDGLDRLWCARFGNASPVSAWVARLGPGGAVQHCAFGVRSLYLVPAGNARIQLAAAPDPALGLLRDGRPHPQQHRLLPGDTLLFAGDPVTQTAATAERPFGPERLEETIEAVRARSLDQIVHEVCDQSLAFAGRPWWREDLLAVAVRHRREGA